MGNINRPNLKAGSKGESVSELQAALKLLGFYKGTVDGFYNNATASAVSQFKQSIGLKPDGIVDASTWQGLFPNDPIVASTESSTRARNFPVPTETNTTTQVNNSDDESTATQTTTTRVVDSDNESTATQTTTNTTRVTNSNEPRPTTRTTTRVTNSNNQPKTTTRTTTNTTRVNPRNEPRPAKPNTTREQRTSLQQSSPTRTQVTRTQSTIRQSNPNRNQSYARTQSTTRTTTSSGVQYTSAGLPILRVGMSGSEVVRLQQRLQRLGYIDDIDGDFGAETEAAVKSLQRRYGLEADGVVGGATWDILSRRGRVN
ncbi:peptidoglycan-binding protein [Iningainema sp. BLCCT55]|uniref:Peptidoglycan-binding protein n=2 Tax=Iningainema TaxID=1932705 RepID=A0A8J6XQU9_9CYAN|nr:peptidoglycan-binding protein [Iningainema tapete BLCC-T55]